MFVGEIILGSFVTLELERQGNIYTLTSKVISTEDTEIVVAPPQLDGKSFRLLERDKIVILAKVDAYLLRWKCEEWYNASEGIVSGIRLKCSEKGERYNRRNAFRLPIDLEEVQATKKDNDKTFKVSIRDISYLGVGFSSYEELKRDDNIYFTIVDENWKFPLEVTILRKEQPKVKGSKYFYGASISVSNRELSKYIAHKQLESVRKNKLKNV